MKQLAVGDPVVLNERGYVIPQGSRGVVKTLDTERSSYGYDAEIAWEVGRAGAVTWVPHTALIKALPR